MPPQDLRTHPWWRHVPDELRGKRLQDARRRELRLRLRRRTVRITGLVVIYAVASALLLVVGGPSLLLLALVPLVLVPAVGWLAWWLTWKEFHH